MSAAAAACRGAAFTRTGCLGRRILSGAAPFLEPNREITHYLISPTRVGRMLVSLPIARSRWTAAGCVAGLTRACSITFEQSNESRPHITTQARRFPRFRNGFLALTQGLHTQPALQRTLSPNTPNNRSDVVSTRANTRGNSSFRRGSLIIWPISAQAGFAKVIQIF